MDNIKNQVDYIKFMHEKYYWDYMYKALHVHCYHAEKLDHALACVSYLQEKHPQKEEENDYFLLRNMICAQFNRSNNKNVEVTIDIEQLDMHDQMALNYIIQFCIDFTYYPWDFINLLDADGIAQYVQTHGTTPPLHPVLKHNEKTQNHLEIIRMKPEASVDDISEEFRKEIIANLECAYSDLEKNCNSDKIKYKKQVNRIHRNNFLRRENLLHKRQACARIQKKLTRPLYKGTRSLWPRILGLMLWEAYSNLYLEPNPEAHSNDHEKNPIFKDVISNATGVSGESAAQMKKNFEHLSMYINSSNASNLLLNKILHDPKHPAQKIYEERYAQRWFEATIESIRKGFYIKI